MPTLKEIKGRIASVRNTLKITSAMKLVASAKLRKAQKATEAMRPYEAQLGRMLSLVQGTAAQSAFSASSAGGVLPTGTPPSKRADFAGGVPKNGTPPAVIVAIASNSSMCGGFNANAIAQVREVRRPGDVVYSVGRKMADAMRKDGFPSPRDLTALAEHPAYAPCAQLVEQLAADVLDGKYARVVLVYNHFVSTARQVPVAEVLLEGSLASGGEALGSLVSGSEVFPDAKERADASGNTSLPGKADASGNAVDAIVEPSRKQLLEILEPKVVKLKLYAALLDSAAAEHAARTVAMQTATDNAENLLQELTLQYNKGRQQKITSEILDLAGGQAQD